MSRTAVSSRQTIASTQNRFVRSSEFDNASWVKDTGTNPTVVANDIANPLTGAVDADRFTDGVGSPNHRLYQGTYTVLPGSVNTISCYFKERTDCRYAGFGIDGTSDAAAVFDLQSAASSGVATDSTFNSLRIVHGTTGFENLGNGWYRCWITFQALTTWTGFWAIHTANASTASGISYVGSASKSIYIWGAQFVKANWPGIYTATTGSAVSNPIRNIVTSRTAVSSRAAIS